MGLIRKKTTCRVPGHGTYCEPARERDRFYCRMTEERMALDFESSADDLEARGRVREGEDMTVAVRSGRCGCPAYDDEHNSHSEAQHTTCGGSLHSGTLPCGGCDDCVSAQVAYYQLRRASPLARCGCGPEVHRAVVLRPICVDPGERVLFEGTLGGCNDCDCDMYRRCVKIDLSSRGA